MNPAAILGLISDLVTQIHDLQGQLAVAEQRIVELEKEPK